MQFPNQPLGQGSRVRPIWSHVRPNFSRVRLKKSEGAPVRPAVREKKKSIRDSESPFASTADTH